MLLCIVDEGPATVVYDESVERTTAFILFLCTVFPSSLFGSYATIIVYTVGHKRAPCHFYFLWTSSRRRHVTVVNVSIIRNTYLGDGFLGIGWIVVELSTHPSADVNHGIDVVTFTSSLSANWSPFPPLDFHKCINKRSTSCNVA